MDLMSARAARLGQSLAVTTRSRPRPRGTLHLSLSRLPTLRTVAGTKLLLTTDPTRRPPSSQRVFITRRSSTTVKQGHMSLMWYSIPKGRPNLDPLPCLASH